MKKIVFLALQLLICGLLSAQKVKTGIEVLQQQNFDPLKHQRIGLITNPTGINSTFESTIDILHKAPHVELVAMYSPEHGVRGDYSAGDQVGFFKDPKTNVPVYSLHGKHKKPTAEMLKGIDVLVYDIQDIGSRSYTYISTLGLAMEAAAENNIKLVVLDRPNPLGGEKMEGMITEPEFTSFVSQFPIPYVHGLTVGELAIFLNEEGLLKDGLKCDLEVISMQGWKRKMSFEETKLPWVPSSPHIPHAHSSYFYPVSGILGELYVYNIGVGYTLPFQVFAAPWIDADSLTNKLNALDLPGITFRPVHFKPYYSVSKGTLVHGVQVHFTNYKEAPLSLIQFYVLQEAHQLWPQHDVFKMCDPSRLSMFDKVSGSDKVRKTFTKHWRVDDIKDMWYSDIDDFRKKAQQYFLYE
ncbi:MULTISPECIES: exo-beta-N-acetylmuramidase NamZ family protein [unclassified Carboxylicivirga]|uniref:exo-beta-N-acetylmuramidase NamZ family protein n=1 Tax=Carboxylicivirga TaxID=1628153 RepID=UPI003D3547A6